MGRIRPSQASSQASGLQASGLLNDLKVGSRIVSHQFDMGDWEADDQIQIEWRAVYVWTVTAEAKAKYAGN